MKEEKACQVEHGHSDSYCECRETTGDSPGHGCSGHHHGAALQDSSGSRLLATLAMNLLIPVAQVIGGLLANSVALISDAAFSCHVVVPDQPVSRTEHLTDRIKHELLHRFRIDHPVLQFETASCGQGTLLCEMACNGETDSISKTQERSGLENVQSRQRM